jgi:hypothetical protein
MKETILTKKAGELSYVDAVGIALMKPLFETGFNLVGVGNNNILSAVIKGVASFPVSKMDGKLAKLAGSALIISSVDDLVTRYLGGGLFAGKSKSGSNTSVVGGSDSNQGALPGVVI